MKKQKHPAFDVLMTLVLTLFVLTLSVSAIIYLKPIYYISISVLKLPETTGISREICCRNYDIMMNYMMPWGPKELVFQDFSMSMRGKVHFMEVKRIFLVIQYAALASGIMTLIGSIVAKRIRAFAWLRNTIVLCVVLLTAVGLVMAIDFNGVFITMHRVLFNNDYWIFDPTLDPIINVLPEGFFFACAAVLLILMGLCLVACGAIYRKCISEARMSKEDLKKGTGRSGGSNGSSRGGSGKGGSRKKKNGSGGKAGRKRRK